MIKSLQIKTLLAAGALLIGMSSFAQVQLNQQTEFMTPIMGINSSGHGISIMGYYDFGTNAITPMEEGVVGTNAITDNGTVLGMIEGSSGNFVPAVRVNGEWTALPASVPLTEEDALYDISENGTWLVGQKAWDPATDTAWGFVYNTQTEEFRLLESALYEYSAAYAVNNDGYAVGWVDDLPGGTLRMPAVFAPNGDIILVAEDAGELNGINNNGVAVGFFGEDGLIYDIAAESSTLIANDSAQFIGLSLADISENGVVVGFASMFSFDRLPVIYHPSLGEGFVLLSDFLADFDIDASELGGTAYKISTNGNYIGGFTDGPAFMAMGWAVYLDDYFADGGNGEECWQGIPSVEDFGMAWRITIGQDFRVAEDFTVPEGSTFTVKQLTFDTSNSEVPDYAIINFRADNGEMPGAILHTIEMEPSSWEEIGFSLGDPIYHVVFDLDEPIEFTEGMYWIDPHMSVPSGGDVWWGGTNLYSDGLTPRTSSDDGENWTVFIALHMVFTVSGDCETLGIGDVASFDFNYYPNPVRDMLHINSAKNIENVRVFNLTGQEVLSNSKVSNGQINMSALPTGVYVFRVMLEGGLVETFKIIKK